MPEFKASYKLLTFLEVPRMPQCNWSNNLGKEMAWYMYRQVMKKKIKMVQVINYFLVTYDQATMMDNGSWVNTHTHILQDF
jgi:hypothetical protein